MGLATLPGRKSIRRIADHAGPGTTDQSLQQFVNQSPWDPRPVRQVLAARALEMAGPTAIVVEEVVFAKHGRFSPGVERQYVRSMGRVSNCQLGLSLSLAGARCSIPIEWHLMLPASWDRDEARRSRAYVPPEERHKPCWQHTMMALDEVSQWPSMPSLPVVAEAPVPAEAAALLAAMEDHRYQCVLRVADSMVATVEDPAAALVPRALPGGPPVGRTAPLRELVCAMAGQRRTLVWTKPQGNLARSQFVTVPVQPGPGEPRSGRNGTPARLLMAEWPLSRPEPTAYWLSNMADHRPADLVRLAQLPDCARETVEEMGRHFGLWDFEGRSFRGWHHHVTLSTAAYVLHLHALQAQADADTCATGVDSDAG